MDLPKFKIILYRICLGVIIIWLLGVAIWEYQIDNHFEAIEFPLLALFVVWQAIKSRHKPNWGWVASMAFLIVLASCFSLRRTYNDHQDKVLLDKYGPVSNARRAKLGIPVIPVNWQAHYYGGIDGEWSNKDSTIGHQNKRVFLDSLHRLDFEEDTYDLKRADSVDRYINIRTHYSKSGSFDSIEYTYAAGMNNKTISRKQADSIFNAEKIQKDY